MSRKTILITGAAGNLGGKLREHFASTYPLVLLDRYSNNGPSIVEADLSSWGKWHESFEGVDTVFHFAADPEAYKSWPELIGPNIDALIHVYHAAILHSVRRIVYASSNHVMGGYQDDDSIILTSETPPQPGLKYQIDGISRSSHAYGAAKLFGERLGKCYAESHGLETIAVRIGWNWRAAPNKPENLPPERGEWFRLMWISDRDFLHLMDCCLNAELPEKFLIVNGMSDNAGMKWDLESARKILCYFPKDDITKETTAWKPTE